MGNTIFVRNASTQVADGQGAQMTAACAKQIVEHVAPAHFVSPMPVLKQL